MSEPILVFPESRLESGIPFVIQIASTNEALPNQVLIDPIVAKGATSFMAPIKNTRPLSGIIELVIDLPGSYRITASDTRRPFEISPRTDLSFGAEFGLFSLAVSLIVGGMVVWLIKKKPL